VGPLTQEILISKSKWNKADVVCSFWLAFSVYADTYKDWHFKKYGAFPLNNCVKSFYHHELKKWKTDYPLYKYDLSKQDNHKVFEEIKKNLDKLVLPLFDKFSDYEKSADSLMDNKEYWWAARIYDYYLMASRPDKAKLALLAGKKFYDKELDPQNELFTAFKLREKEII
jgi:hypothetical protein